MWRRFYGYGGTYSTSREGHGRVAYFGVIDSRMEKAIRLRPGLFGKHAYIGNVSAVHGKHSARLNSLAQLYAPSPCALAYFFFF